MADLDELVAITQEQVGALIAKPKMSSKLLHKPPFRFLHDVIFAIGRDYGFPDLNIFDESEMVGKAIKERGAKVAFLEKTIKAVEEASGQQVAMRPNKVVAGLEPELTNEFLQLLASVASGGGGGGAEGKEQAAEPADDGGKEEELRHQQEEEDRRRAAEEEEERRRQQQAQEAEDRRRAAEDARRAQEAAAAAEAAKAQEFDDGGKDDGGPDDDPLAGPVVADGQIATTQALLGRIIQKPRLSDKLLSKPPYRFLHDIAMKVEQATGFGAGLFEGDELNGKIKDRDLKVRFLTKFINCIALHLNVTIAARPAKIVAGLEPELTNEMLQYLAFACSRGDSADAVRRVLNGEEQGSGGGQRPEANSPRDDGAAERAREAASRQAAEQAEYQRQQQQAAAQRAREEAEAQAAAAAAAAAAEEQRQKAREAASAASYGAGASAGAGAASDPVGGAAPSGGVRRLARPTTARRRPPRVREKVQQMEAEAKKPSAVGIMTEGDASDSEEEDVPEETKADTFGAPDPAAGGAGGAGKLTRGILDAERNAAANKAQADKPQEKKGTGIRMGRIKKAGASGASYSQVDIDKLRGYIQKLCQSTNPLGKCMDYVLEDIEAMKGELSAWQADYRRRVQDLEVEREATRDEIVPLERELKQADQRIEEQVGKINSVKAKIAKNDARIQELLRMVVSW